MYPKEIQTSDVVVEYRYDSYGNLDDSITLTGVGLANPYRYRIYRFDNETGYYYFQSRYYNPETGRFINADGLLLSSGTTLGHNMYAYVNNNPVMYSDISGYAPKRIENIWNWGNTAFGSLRNVTFKIAVVEIALITALVDGRVSDIVHDFKSGAMNPFNQDESIALNSKVFSFYKGSIVIRHSLPGTSCSIFGTIFLNTYEVNNSSGYRTLNHEWGHSVQERIMGAFYIPFVAVPSVTYYMFGDPNLYYSQPWERTADFLGGVNRGGYTSNALTWSIAYTIAPYATLIPYIIYGN
jgi:RHS repeat-associated protein